MSTPSSSLDRLLRVPPHTRLRKVAWFDEVTGGRITIEAPPAHTGTGMAELLRDWQLGAELLLHPRFRIAATGVDVTSIPGEARVIRRRGDLGLRDLHIQAELAAWREGWRFPPWRRRWTGSRCIWSRGTTRFPPWQPGRRNSRG